MDKFTQDVYNTLLQLSDGNGVVTGYTRSQLAFLMGLPEENKYQQRVSRAIDRLVNFGMLSRIYRGGRKQPTSYQIVKNKAKGEPTPAPEVETKNIPEEPKMAEQITEEIRQINHVIDLVEKAYKYDRLLALIKEYILD